MPSNGLTDSPEWKALQEHACGASAIRTRALFEQDPERFDKFHIALDGLLFDYSKHPVTVETMTRLIALARAAELESWRDKMFAGAQINTTEDRAVLHTALRHSAPEGLEVDGENVAGFISNTHEHMRRYSESIRREGLIRDVVVIGIGGPNLGPNLVYEALSGPAGAPRVHFVSNIDGTHITQTLEPLSPDHTLFIISSKTFKTLETLENAQTAKGWLDDFQPGLSREHMAAVTTNREDAEAFGIAPSQIFPLREWIGGRYSLWSAVGLPIAIAHGFDQFEALLEGARTIDTHFQTAPLDRNIPVIMALLGLWHRNFRNCSAHAILPYAQKLSRLPAYIQQVDMESNGKNTDRDGIRVDYETGPVIFGGPGTDAQHAFFQLLHQGTDIIPSDFILVAHPDHGLDSHHRQLLASALAQTQALMEGRTSEPANDAPHRRFDGNRPVSTLILDQLDAYHLGMLLALYEHKIFVQGILWRLNSFDQWGVELGKTLAQDILHQLNPETTPTRANPPAPDPSTQNLATYLFKSFINS
ncbi:MAG: glucose-6-phosphate isomerase [Alphaproteobacteria bacterium]